MMHQFLPSGVNCIYFSLIITVCFGALVIAVLTGVIISSTQESQKDKE